MEKLPIGDDTQVLVLTGSGISAESGIATYRGAGGLWQGHSFEHLASPKGFTEDPVLVWDFYLQRRKQAAKAPANLGHRALAQLEESLGDRLLLATQNVDGLHFRAGSKRVIELHGNMFRTRCSNPLCDVKFSNATFIPETTPPGCFACGSLLRPDVVWFGESLAADGLEQISEFIQQGKQRPFIFVAIGTSGAVQPASLMVQFARIAGATTVLVNVDEADNEEDFDFVYRGKAGEILPALL